LIRASSSGRWLLSLCVGALAALAVLIVGWLGIALLAVLLVPGLGIPSKAAVLAGFLLASGLGLLFGSLLPLGVALLVLALVVAALSLGSAPSRPPA
jgi:hypothetical protein